MPRRKDPANDPDVIYLKQNFLGQRWLSFRWVDIEYWDSLETSFRGPLAVVELWFPRTEGSMEQVVKAWSSWTSWIPDVPRYCVPPSGDFSRTFQEYVFAMWAAPTMMTWGRLTVPDHVDWAKVTPMDVASWFDREA